MEQQISRLYSEYGLYINRFRAFPFIYDGLKMVERRLLYSLFEIAQKNLVKSAQVVGRTIGEYHPHGDASCYGSLVALVQGHMAIGQGNWGCSAGIDECPAAAQRYTEVKMDPRIVELAFEYIDYVPKEALEVSEEPLFLPTALPLCLVNTNYCQGIGFGFKTSIPSYTIPDLVKRLRWLLGYDPVEPIIRPLTDCSYLSEDVDFQRILTTGIGKLTYRGHWKIEKDTKSIVVHSIPPNRSFRKILKHFEDDITTKNIGFRDESTSVTRVRFNVLKKTFDLARLQNRLLLQMTSTMTFACHMHDREGKVRIVSIDAMLLNVYRNYKMIVDHVLRHEINEIEIKIQELKLIEQIKVVLPDIIKQHGHDIDRVIQSVFDATQISVEMIKKLFDKYTLSRFFKVRTDIDEHQQKLDMKKNNLANIDSYIWNKTYEKLLLV